jgi:APA family basic amino acid/polyamine antiporter
MMGNDSSGTSGGGGPGLSRHLGLWTAVAVVVANMIGTGIFTITGFMARDVPHPLLILGLWLIGGLIALCGALSVGELGAMLPYAGGEYVYLKRGYGPLWGYLAGWISFCVGFSAPIAAAGIAVSEYTAYFLPALSPLKTVTLHLGPAAFKLSWGQVVAVGVIFAFGGIHYFGLKSSRMVQVGITALKITLLFLFVLAGIYVGRGHWGNLTIGVVGELSPARMGVSLIFVMYAYSGWNAATYIAGEIKNPGRNLPRALILGTVTVILLYLGFNLFYLLALPLENLAGVVRVGSESALALFGPGITGIMTVIFIISLLACVSAMVFVGPRVYYAMAKDNLFFGTFRRVHPKFATPDRAILLQVVWSAVLVLAGTFEQLLTYASFMLMFFSALNVGTVYVLRRKLPDLKRPYKAWGYPWTPLIFIVMTVWMMAYTLFERPTESLLGLLTLVVGIGLYFIFQRSSSTEKSRL